MPDVILHPLTLEIIDGGNFLLVEAGDTLTLETQNLSAEVSGHVGTTTKGKLVTLTIIRPDNTQESVDVLVNRNGDYFFPTKLADNWQSGKYNLIAEYNGLQIGNIPFTVKSSTEYEFGGMLPSPSSMTILALEKFVDLKISKTQLNEKLSKLNWNQAEIKDLNDRLRSIFYVNPPKHQTNDGISSDEIQCNVGLIPVIKSSNDNPLCITPDTAEKLSERKLISYR